MIQLTVESASWLAAVRLSLTSDFKLEMRIPIIRRNIAQGNFPILLSIILDCQPPIELLNR